MPAVAQLLLITGPPASGKTRLAAALSARYASCCLCKDQFKEPLLEVLGTGDAAWSRRLSDVSFALLFALTPRLLTSTRLLLLEGNFRAGEHEPPLRRLLREQCAPLAQVLCQASAATRRARLDARLLEPTRHAGHADHRLTVAASPSDDFLDLPGLRLVFDSDADWERELAALCQRLDPWVASGASGGPEAPVTVFPDKV